MTHLISRGQPLEPGYLNNLRVAIRGWGVVSGLAVSQRAAGANMSVDVAIGTAIINGVSITKSSVTNVAVTAAHATYDRYDFVVINSSGTISMIAGTAAATSYAPDYDFETNNAILLAEIYIPATDTAIEDAQITDKRVYAPAGLNSSGIGLDIQNAAVNTTHIAAAAPHSGHASKSDINLLSVLTPTITGTWDTQPATTSQMSDENADQLLTTAGYQTSSAPKVGYVTYDLGSIKRVIVMAGVLPTNSSANYEVSRDGAAWHNFGSVSAGGFVLSSIVGAWRYIRVVCNNNSNTTSYTKIKMSAYALP